jgi:hypothetical protein
MELKEQPATNAAVAPGFAHGAIKGTSTPKVKIQSIKRNQRFGLNRAKFSLETIDK